MCPLAALCSIYGLDLPTSSVTTCMRGAKAGVSPLRRSLLVVGNIYIFGKTPESGIPPSYRATRRYTKAHLGFCLRFSTLIGQKKAAYRFSALDPGGTSGRGYSGRPSPLSGVPLPLPGGKKASESRDISADRSHDRTAFESFAPDISEQPDPNLTDFFDTRNHGSQRLSARYQHTRDVVVTRTHQTVFFRHHT